MEHLDWSAISEHIARETQNIPSDSARAVPLAGGSINNAWRLEAGNRKWFVKINRAERLAMFTAEAAGLRELAAAEAVRVPRPVVDGCSGAHAYLVLEWLETGGGQAGAAASLGRLLARQHGVMQTRFGWERDNTIGTTPQQNAQSNDWVGFWRERRLSYQLRLAAENGHGGALARQGEKLLDQVEAFFSDYTPRPSLLHGDLWGGNWSALASGEPVVFDPAVYYGDREADIAMTELFGGFPPDFYAAYNDAWPLDPGYRTRRDLYNLYHVLNHLNLFGGGYRHQAEQLIARLLAGY
jgi:fructosamine-3-kinase